MASLRNRILLACCLVTGAAAVPVLWSYASRDAAPARTRTWEDTLTKMDQDPAQLRTYLAERGVTRDGNWDYRWLPEPARHLWATLQFEAGMMEPSSLNPTVAEVADAYTALGLPELAQRIAALPTQTAKEMNVFQVAFAAASGQITAARRKYVEEHRRELESL